MKKGFLSLLILLLLLAGIVLARAVLFRSKQRILYDRPENRLDVAASAQRLSEAIQYKTVSTQGSAAGEFLRFHEFLRNAFPRVHKTLMRELIGDYSLLYTWQGSDESLKPILLMAHMDVVPVDPSSEKNWTHPPFAGRIADGYIWGRGVMDDKAGVMGILEAVENSLTRGFQPRRTVYLAFGHDEEIGGNHGGAKIAALLSFRKVVLEYVLDEGGNITEGIIPGIDRPVALIGIAEKGYVSLELTVESSGGHSSIPPARTAIGILSNVIVKLDEAPFPSRVPEPTRRFFEFIGPELDWMTRTAVANLWLFEPLVRRKLETSPTTDAMVRTTQATTIFRAGVQENELPIQARAVVNYRVLTGDTIAAVIDRVRKVIDDPRVKVTPLPIQIEPSPLADIDSASFNLIHGTIRQVAPDSVVAPFLLVAATDSRHYAKLAKNIYRFLPITLRSEDAKRFHGIDERISVPDYERCVRFFIQLIRNSSS